MQSTAFGGIHRAETALRLLCSSFQDRHPFQLPTAQRQLPAHRRSHPIQTRRFPSRCSKMVPRSARTMPRTTGSSSFPVLCSACRAQSLPSRQLRRRRTQVQTLRQRLRTVRWMQSQPKTAGYFPQSDWSAATPAFRQRRIPMPPDCTGSQTAVPSCCHFRMYH